MVAIEVNYLGPTTHKPSRVKALANGHSVTLSWDHSLSNFENYATAAKCLCHKLEWKGQLSGGFTDSGMVWTFVAIEYLIDC